MKIGVIGDVHLGASYSLGKKDYIKGINSRLVDYDNTLIETIKIWHLKGASTWSLPVIYLSIGRHR